MTIKLDDIEYAYMFANTDGGFLNSAIINRETGDIYYISDLGDNYELPDDIYESDKYIEIPNQMELDLGQKLVFEFIYKYLPEASGHVQSIFSRKGAYSRFKSFLENKGLLKKWHEFEDEKITSALIEWCNENNIDIQIK